HGLEETEMLGGRGKPVRLDARFDVDDLLDARDKPRIDLAGGVHLLGIDAEAQGLRDLEKTVGSWPAEGCPDHVLVVAATEAFKLDVVETGETGFHRAERLLQAFGERAPDGHGLADRAHGGGEGRVRALE